MRKVCGPNIIHSRSIFSMTVQYSAQAIDLDHKPLKSTYMLGYSFGKKFLNYHVKEITEIFQIIIPKDIVLTHFHIFYTKKILTNVSVNALTFILEYIQR